MSDCRFGVSPVNYPDPDPDPDPVCIYDRKEEKKHFKIVFSNTNRPMTLKLGIHYQ